MGGLVNGDRVFSGGGGWGDGGGMGETVFLMPIMGTRDESGGVKE